MKTLPGFSKRGSTFERRHGETLQLVELQRSAHGSTLYVNVGIVFDAVTKLGASTTGARVIGKRPVHHGARVEDLGGIERALELLDRIDGPAAALKVLDLERGFEKLLRAQLKSLVGDRAGALADVEAVAKEFSDRRGCTVNDLLTRTGLR